jgi:hypothetical protein
VTLPAALWLVKSCQRASYDNEQRVVTYRAEEHEARALADELEFEQMTFLTAVAEWTRDDREPVGDWTCPFHRTLHSVWHDRRRAALAVVAMHLRDHEHVARWLGAGMLIELDYDVEVVLADLARTA